MNDLSIMTDSNIMLFDDSRFAQLEKISQVMSQGTVSIPKHLQQKPGDCLAVAMQAAQWGMNPFAVAQKTYFINHTISYEAQLVNAVISSSKAIKGAFKYKYDGPWDKIAGTKPQSKSGWGDLEKGLTVSVGAILAGDEEITWGEPVYLSSVMVRNSPLWQTHVKQQIAYLAVNMWARMYTPAVILGVYTPEEVEMHDITPTTLGEDEQQEKLDAHKAKVNKAKTKTPTKKKTAPIEGTAEVVEETAAEVMPIADFVKKMKATATQQEIKDVAAMGTHFTGADKAKASKAYKDRVAAFKAEHEAPVEEETPEPRPISEAYRMLDVAKTNDDLDVACDYVLSLNQELKTTKEELNDFQIKSGAMYDKFVDKANASNN